MTTDSPFPATYIERNKRRISELLFAALLLFVCSAPQASETTYVFDIPAGQLTDTLRTIGRQAGKNVMFNPALVEGKTAPQLQQKLTVHQAIIKILNNTNLTYEPAPGDTIIIKEKTPLAGSEQTTLRLAQNTGPENSRSRGSNGTEPESPTGADSGADKNSAAAQEVLVTGTHIRGVKNTASPLQVFTREELERTGYSTVDQFVQSLPQNFGGGIAQDSGRTGGESNNNDGDGSAINIRGLGAGATLVLLNGHRLAPAGRAGSFADVSMIPMQAIERIEVLTDGASALYGADAVGGVVNFVLRDDFTGAETALRYGMVTDGDVSEKRLAQTLGTRWNSGKALMSYSYYTRDELKAQDRDFASSAALPWTLLPEQKQHSVLIDAHQDAGERLSFNGNILYSKRKSQNDRTFTAYGLSIHSLSDNEQAAASFGAQFDLTNDWSAKASAAYSDYALDYNALYNGVPTFNLTSDTKVRSLDLLLDGKLLQLPGGAARVAFGASYREEDYTSSLNNVVPGRNVRSAFGELFVPLATQLELSLALRHEDYSDFGSSATPKVGLHWAPRAGLNLRATYGESFKAPLLDNFKPGETVVIYNIPPYPLYMGRLGNDPDVGAEESKSWTAGFDIQPEGVPLSIKVTYYNIDFTGRIVEPVPTAREFFADPQQFAGLFIANPGAALLNQVIANANQFIDTSGGANLDSLAYLIDNRMTNIAVEKQSGYDLSVSYLLSTALGSFDFSLNGTHISKFERRATPNATAFEFLNIISAPIDLRLRGGLTWTKDALTTSAFINHLGGYEDSHAADAVSIDSWTTVDLQLRYDLDGRGALLNGTSVSLNVANAFDTNPPRVAHEIIFPFANPGYDPANADPLGRFVAFEITKRW